MQKNNDARNYLLHVWSRREGKNFMQVVFNMTETETDRLILDQYARIVVMGTFLSSGHPRFEE